MKHCAQHIFVVCIAISLMGIAGCRPRGVLSTREMRNVLYDLHRADGAIQVAGYNYSHDTELAAYYKSVLDKHGITQAQFDTSLVWYTDNPQIFNKIYPAVIERLESDLAQQEAIRQELTLNANDNAPADKAKQEAVGTKTIQQLLQENLHNLHNPWQIWEDPSYQNDSIYIFSHS